MELIVLYIFLILTVAKTLAVADAVLGGCSGSVVRAAQTISSRRSPAPARSPIASPRWLPQEPFSAGTSKARSLHRRLLTMHVATALSQCAGVAKHVLPVSDTSCLVTHRAMMAMYLLFDACMVLFLLAKVHVTNDGRVLACWEKSIIWVSRLYGWVYLPFAMLGAAFTFPGSANSEGTDCINEYTDRLGTEKLVRQYVIYIGGLIAQFFLLLGLFVKPLLVRVEGSQSGGALYRRVVRRNVIATAGIATSSLMTMLVYFIAMRKDASLDFRDVAYSINNLGTLCLTEIALPIGFTSCFTSFRRMVGEGKLTSMTAKGQSDWPGTTQARTAANVKVLPVEELLPQTP